MPQPTYQRFAISIPTPMAVEIKQVCQHEGRNRSEFFREAVRFYMSAGHMQQPREFVLPTKNEVVRENPFRLFTEWDSEADTIYDSLR